MPYRTQAEKPIEVEPKEPWPPILRSSLRWLFRGIPSKAVVPIMWTVYLCFMGLLWTPLGFFWTWFWGGIALCLFFFLKLFSQN